MSLTTVAATVQPDEELLNLPPSHPERFQLSDFIAAGFVFVITLGVYIATLAPNVTLLDSGELITAATKLGVGHPPGYPLWTLSGFLLSHLFPFGNLAWRINLQSALFGAESNAVLTLLSCHSGRFCFYTGLFVGLTIGFSDVMWSQAVIAAVHGTLNALFINLVLLLFYLWMIEPQKTHRLIAAVFVFALGLTNHHTLIQAIPAFLLGAALVRAGKFWSVTLAINLFSLSILAYISWLSGDEQLHSICEVMAELIFGVTIAVSFFYLKEFRLNLFFLGAVTAVAIFCYGNYLMTAGETPHDYARYTLSTGSIWQLGSLKNPGWLQITSVHGLLMMGLGALALGLLYSSSLNRRLIIGVFVAGWIGLIPYSYEPFASSTNPPMNWGFASERSGFYYAVSREQYPKSLPNLIKTTIGKAIGVVPKDAQLDATIGLPNYYPRLGLTFYYYGYNLQQNFTVPLIFLTLAVLLYIRRFDTPQVNWFIFLGVAFFFLGFMLQLIAPQEAFDFQHNLSYKVFHLQSHCIFVLVMGYGLLAGLTYLYETMPEITEKAGVIGFGAPAIFLSLLPLWSNFDGCNQADHWFGYYFGADILRPLEKNAVYFGGSDPGRFVPTYTAFVESQQDDRWKREPGFDRRDVAVITQNALCDSYYNHYIRDQYDPRFRPAPESYSPFEKWLGRDVAYPKEPIVCLSNEELVECWDEYQTWPAVRDRIKNGGPVLRPGTNDVWDVNGIAARKIFEKNKKDHAFYIEQSVPIDWMYPYLLPSGLILKLNPEPRASIRPDEIATDYKFWDDYSKKLLDDPKFHLDSDAMLTFSRLAYWHADLYHWRHLDKEEEHWLKLSLALCPPYPDAVNNLARLLARQSRFDEAEAMVKTARDADPRNDQFTELLDWLDAVRMFTSRESDMRDKLKQSPYDVALNLKLAQLLNDEGKYDEVNEKLRTAAGLTNWSQEDMASLVHYYVDTVRNPEAAIAFLEARAQIDPKASELVYNLAALHCTLNHQDAAITYLAQAAQYGGTNALASAQIDPRFDNVRNDPRFQALLNSMTNASATNAPPASKHESKKVKK